MANQLKSDENNNDNNNNNNNYYHYYCKKKKTRSWCTVATILKKQNLFKQKMRKDRNVRGNHIRIIHKYGKFNFITTVKKKKK